MTEQAPVAVGVLGAGGRMGEALLSLIADDTRLRLAGAVERAGHSAVGRALGEGTTIGANALALAHHCDVLIDFTTPAALAEHLDAACDARCALVIGTTGLSEDSHAAIDLAARNIAVLQAANTSLGVTLLAALVEQAAARLGRDWDIEILEMHHRHKVDAPSGTALMLGEAAAAGRGVPLQAHAVRVRDGHTGARRAGDIGFATLRGGSVAGDHLVMLAGDGERIELGHRAEDRRIFARGALHAAAWIARRPAGRYGMADALGLR